jgi:hypothetical protein
MSSLPADPPRLRALPPTFGATMASLHRVAERIVSPARKPDEMISLQATPAGFGTPAFAFGGARHQVRVEGTDLVHSVDDEEHSEPYLYVGPWTAAVSGELWQATGFDGAELTYAELFAATDQQAAALDFFTTRKEAL